MLSSLFHLRLEISRHFILLNAAIHTVQSIRALVALNV